jgi:hypothetical protein
MDRALSNTIRVETIPPEGQNFNDRFLLARTERDRESDPGARHDLCST